MNRRGFLALTGAAALAAPAADAHTLYKQWLVYRQKHLLIGSHRGPGGTFAAAQDLVSILGHLLPEAQARAARAPFPERIASLIGTRQMDVAVLLPEEARAIRNGSGEFRPYGQVPLTLLADFRPHVIVAHADFATHHGWLLAAAIHEGAVPPPVTLANGTGLPLHGGARAFLEGVDLETLAANPAAPPPG